MLGATPNLVLAALRDRELGCKHPETDPVSHSYLYPRGGKTWSLSLGSDSTPP